MYILFLTNVFGTSNHVLWYLYTCHNAYMRQSWETKFMSIIKWHRSGCYLISLLHNCIMFLFENRGSLDFAQIQLKTNFGSKICALCLRMILFKREITRPVFWTTRNSDKHY